MYVRLDAYVCMYMCVCVCVCTYIYIYTHTYIREFDVNVIRVLFCLVLDGILLLVIIQHFTKKNPVCLNILKSQICSFLFSLCLKEYSNWPSLSTERFFVPPYFRFSYISVAKSFLI